MKGFEARTLLALEAAMTSWSRIDGQHRLIVSRDGSIVATSDRAERFLANTDVIRLRKGKLYAGSKVGEGALNRALGVVAGEAVAETLSSQNRQRRCIVRSTPFDETLICLALQPVEESRDPLVKPDLKAAFGLTRSETTVVLGICSGQTPQTIADENKISIHTVRAHLRHCYGKLGVTCREELWYRLQPYLV